MINSTLGTYFLKRTPSTQQLAFAHSLDHVPAKAASRQDGDQPPAPARAPSPAPTPAPVPVLESAPALFTLAAQLTRDQLEAKYAKLAAGLAAATAELEAAQASVLTLARQNKSLQASKESISSDFNYMQAQYSEASSAALARAREAAAAEAEVAELRTKVGLGMAQRDKVMEGLEKRWRFEVGRMEGEVRLLKEEKRRSEVPVWQEKAALWEAHLAREKLRREGAMESSEGEEREEAEVAPSEQAVTLPDGERPRLWTRPRAQTQGSTVQTGNETTLGSSQAGQVGSLELGFECEWRREGGGACGAVVASKEELRDHVMRAHVPLQVTLRRR